MQFIENYFEKPDNYLIVAEDEFGLFCLLLLGADNNDQEKKELQKDPRIKWICDFHNQRPENRCCGSREAATDFFRALRVRNLDLPASMAFLLEEIKEDD